MADYKSELAVVHSDISIPITITGRRAENGSYTTVSFNRPISFDFEAGDWIDIDFADTSISGGKTYSLSSSPTETELSITFRNGISPFKQRLQAADVGSSLVITQYGNDYGFHLNENRSSVLIAGGIGVAPFHSMLKELADTNAKSSVHLIYLNKTEDFLFKSELDTWQAVNPQLTMTYIATETLKRKVREQRLSNLLTTPADRYFIAGTESMVVATKRLLLSNGVNARDIRIDNFGAY